MQERLRAFGKGIASHRMKIGSTAAVLVFAVIAALTVVTRPQWQVVVSSQSSSEADAIKDVLQGEGIAARLVQDATGVAVQLKDRDRALIVLSDSKALVSMDFTYEDALTVSGIGTTEDVKEKAFRRAQVSELSRTLALYDWVNSATVSVALPDEDVFFVSTMNNRPTVSVLLDTNRAPDEQQVNSMVRLLTSSIENLSVDDIEIVDQNAQTLYTGIHENADEGLE